MEDAAAILKILSVLSLHLMWSCFLLANTLAGLIKKHLDLGSSTNKQLDVLKSTYLKSTQIVNTFCFGNVNLSSKQAVVRCNNVIMLMCVTVIEKEFSYFITKSFELPHTCLN